MICVEKHCKCCGILFSFNYEPSGKGSGNKLKRAHCSPECQKTDRRARTRLPMSTRLSKNCIVCNALFYVPPSLSARQMCSNECRHKNQSRIATKLVTLTLECEQCGSKFETKTLNRKYCKPACFSASLVDKLTVNCEVCDVSITTKRSYRPRFCSKSCTRKAQSMGLIDTKLGGRTGFRYDIPNLYFKSSFEADYMRYCNQILKTQPEYEKKTFHVCVSGKMRYYTPDFWFPSENRFVELKAVPPGLSGYSQLMNSNHLARQTLVNQGENIEVIYMRDFYDMLQEKGFYDVIINLERRDYAGTKHLIRRRDQNSVD